MRIQVLILFQLIIILCFESHAQTLNQIETKELCYISTLGEYYYSAFDKLKEDRKKEALKLDSICCSARIMLLENSVKKNPKMLPWKRKRLENDLLEAERSIRIYLLSSKQADIIDR